MNVDTDTPRTDIPRIMNVQNEGIPHAGLLAPGEGMSEDGRAQGWCL